MLAEWREEMATGNEAIDKQHQDLLRRVRSLLNAVRSCGGDQEIGKLFWFLKGYVRKHFTLEESLQLRHGFPGYLAHKTQHEVFIRQVRRLENRFAEEGASTIMIVQAVLTMCGWLQQHFDRMDKKMAEFVRDAENRSRGGE